jgi:hypothetical protein
MVFIERFYKFLGTKLVLLFNMIILDDYTIKLIIHSHGNFITLLTSRKK